MSARAAIVVTGTEVLTGRVSRPQRPLAGRPAASAGHRRRPDHVVGDRPEDLPAALASLRELGVDLVITSGGLGPTADDLTADGGRRVPRARDGARRRSSRSTSPRSSRRCGRAGGLDPQAIARCQPQAGADARRRDRAGAGRHRARAGRPARRGHGRAARGRAARPAARAAGHVAAARSRPRVRALRSRGAHRVCAQRTLRIFGTSRSPRSRRRCAPATTGVELGRLEITTCLRDGELEIVTRYEPDAGRAYDAFEDVVRERHARHALLRRRHHDRRAGRPCCSSSGRRVATAESCTGGLLAGRLTDRAGSSAYVRGGIVAYSNEAKTDAAGVPAEMIERHGAVSRRSPGAGRRRAERSAPTSGWASPGWPARRRHRGEAGRVRSASRPKPPSSRDRPGARPPSCPASAAPDIRERSTDMGPCTCCAGCCCGESDAAARVSAALRLFIAAEPPAAVCDELARWARRAVGRGRAQARRLRRATRCT